MPKFNTPNRSRQTLNGSIKKTVRTTRTPEELNEMARKIRQREIAYTIPLLTPDSVAINTKILTGSFDEFEQLLNK